MKRCPQCNRVESDDALVYCRVDGTALITDFGSIVGQTGPAKFGSGFAESSEIETSILPHRTDADASRPTAPTTVLPSPQTPGTTRELSKSNRRKVIVVIAVVCALGLAVVIISVIVSAFLYRSRTHTTAITSIAVMPFVNASGNADVEYLSDGMTETLISSLSQLPNLNVKARSSVFRYKGKETNPQNIGKELNVQALLNGRVVQRGDQLTLSLELIDAQTENVIWSQQYVRKQTDLVTLQSEIARDVSNKLRLKLSAADEQKLAKKYTENAEAHQLYLKGRFYWNKRTPTDFKKAVEYFRQAISADPNYALAYAGLADGYALLSSFSVIPPHEGTPKAREFALKALSLDSSLAEPHATLGLTLTDYDFDFAAAEREFRRAIEIDPNYATGHQWYGQMLGYVGRSEESFAQFRRALEIDPLSLPINWNYGKSLYFARKYDESVAQLKKTLELDANFYQAHVSLAQVYQARHNYAESVGEYARAEELFGGSQNAKMMRESFAKGGWQGFLRATTVKNRPSSLWFRHFATFHAELGENDKAFAELNEGYESHDSDLESLRVEPLLDPLRSDPRFQELLKKVGFPQ